MQNVYITNSNGQVDQTDIRVSKSGAEEVTWHSHDNKPATIKFDSAEGSPFEKSVFTVPPGGNVSSGPAHGAAQHKSYKYTVVGPDGENDPVVIIDK
jgi:hypothetical protein